MRSLGFMGSRSFISGFLAKKSALHGFSMIIEALDRRDGAASAFFVFPSLLDHENHVIGI